MTDSHTDCWRSQGERTELVERVIRLTDENRQLRAVLREKVGDDTNLVLALCARIEGLEQNLERMARQRPTTKGAA